MLIKLNDGTVYNSVSNDAVSVVVHSYEEAKEVVEKFTAENLSHVEIDDRPYENVTVNGNKEIHISENSMSVIVYLNLPSELDEIKTQIVELQNALMEIVEG